MVVIEYARVGPMIDILYSLLDKNNLCVIGRLVCYLLAILSRKNIVISTF